jgi:transposase
MESLDEIINDSKDTREVKRALSVKMVRNGISPETISQMLNVSVKYVSKWKMIYEAEGAAGLGLGYQGRQSYLNEADRKCVIRWINSHETLSLEALHDHLESHYGVIYQSKQSYYDLLAAGGMSYHKSEKANPKRDEVQVQARREELKKKLAPHWDAIQQGDTVVLLEDECHLLWGGCLWDGLG